MNELEAVNRILRAGQINRVLSLATSDRFVIRAFDMLQESRVRCLEKGWQFNTDLEFELTPVAGEIAVPVDTLSLDVLPDQGSGRIVVRSGQLYDLESNSDDDFDTPIKCKIVRDIGFDDLELVFQEYIVACASVEFAKTVAVDLEVSRQLQSDEYRAWHMLKQRDTQQSSASTGQQYPLAQIASNWPIIYPQ